MLTATGAPAQISEGRSLMQGPSGRWAAERMLKAMQEGRRISPAELRTLDALPRESWIEFDRSAIREGMIRSPLVTAMLAAGLSIPIANAMGKTLFQYDAVTDMSGASVSLDGLARTDNDTVEWVPGQVPLPITHKDFNIGLRRLEASRNGGEPLDSLQSEISGRIVGETVENMVINGGPQFAGLSMYGFTNFPKRNTIGFGTNGNWLQVAKTGSDIFKDVSAMAAALRAKRFYGPYWLLIPGTYPEVLDNDYSSAKGDNTVRDRLMKIEGLSKILTLDQLATNNVILFQATKDVAAVANGEGIQTVQWDLYGGFAIAFKVFCIQAPVLRATEQSRSGVIHMS